MISWKIETCWSAELTNSYRMAVKTQLYLCNIRGVSVCTNVSANYMFWPLPVRPSSGWT